MGTYYAVQYLPRECEPAKALFETRLQALNKVFSTYMEDSEISRLNQSTATNWVDVSAEFAKVLQVAAAVHEDTFGALDITLAPLIDLWGFGPGATRRLPDLEAQANAAANVGMELLELRGTELRKHQAGVRIDLSALAKGYAVDEMVAELDKAGCRNAMADIGGEIRVLGQRDVDQPWRVGIEIPSVEQAGMVQGVIGLVDMAIATSGDYRNFQVLEGRNVHHIFDPWKKAPAQTEVASVTVVHDSAMLADAYATAFMVLGKDRALSVANEIQLPVYLITRDADNLYSHYNDAMQALLLNP